MELVAEQRLLVALLVEERRLLEVAGGQVEVAVRLLHEQPGVWRLGTAAQHVCVANAQALSLGNQVRWGTNSLHSQYQH
jgi:hypothetical protein